MAQGDKERALVLVKAFPQPSQKYDETVCCAGVTPEGKFVRLYPIRFRHLPINKQFNRWDVLEYFAQRPVGDHRPESRHVSEDSIAVVQFANQLNEEQKVRAWLPHVSPSLEVLKQENLSTGRSLGIVKPDEDSLRFKARKLSKDSEEDAELKSTFRQFSLLDPSALNPITVEYEFSYQFTCDGRSHNMKIHDWEVQSAFHRFKRDYGDGGMDALREQYQQRIPERNLHFVMGTMKAHPRQFIIIGLLRSGVAPADVARQRGLF
ncbi:hypothetical protein [Ottowia sp.]|uniref:hypothetical protein n=1 Tax=Ottowia sp. TaxID=1898956 RepID=UPI0025D0239F|nr:hypothetical protein [Ottowia sp.]